MAANKYVAQVSGKLKEIYASVVGTANAIPAGDATGRLDLSWMPVGVGPEIIQAVASEALAIGAFVNIWNNAGVLTVRNADSTTNAKKAHGFVIAAVASAGTASIYTLSQTNTQLTGLTLGNEYYLGTGGAVTLTPPSTTGNLVQMVGTATSATAIIFTSVMTIEIG